MARLSQFSRSIFSCDVSSDRIFAGLSTAAFRDLAGIQRMGDYPAGAVLFEEGEESHGIYLLCRGAVRLSIRSARAQHLVLRLAHPGEILGVSATVSGKPHEATAETAGPAQLLFIKRKDFLRYLKEHTEACLHVVHFLSNDVHAAYDRVRALGMARTRQSRN